MATRFRVNKAGSSSPSVFISADDVRDGGGSSSPDGTVESPRLSTGSSAAVAYADTAGNADDQPGDSAVTNNGKSGDGGASVDKEQEQLMTSLDVRDVDTHLALYQDEEAHRPFVSCVINHLATYQGGIVPNVKQRKMHRQDSDVAKSGCRPKKKRAAAGKKAPRKLGTVLGVYFPCIQNIFGVILFIRLVWVVGVAGWLQALIIVLMCCCCTMITSISMSAIATNGVVSGGGSYFMISRALGPEFGGAVGVLFYLGTTVAAAMYIVGAIEILVQYIAPVMSLFGPINIPMNAYNNCRVYGTILCFLMFVCVFIGVKFVSKFSPIALFCVVLSILCVYIGIFVANPSRGPEVCFLGDRLMASDKIRKNDTGEMDCNKLKNGTIYGLYCGRVKVDPETGEEVEVTAENDDYCRYFHEHDVTKRPGIPGLASGVFLNNTMSRYSDKDDIIGTSEKGDRDMGDIVADITTSFVVLAGIFFPSVTGIMAGSNRSGDLADASKAIPTGTIAAVATTSFVYISCLLFFGGCIEGQLLRDKFGESIGSGLVVAVMSWPNPWVILIGSFLSTCGAGLQTLTGAPRLLQAIAADGIIPFLRPFAVTSKNGEPRRALFLTIAIAEAGVLLANVDYIAPIITMFFLMCYCFTNLACAVQTILRTPNWRPRFRLYHWLLSLFGVCLCLVIMFITSWYYALAAIVLAGAIYKYIEYKGAEKEWGDGIRGLSMSAAWFALLKLEEGPPHVKNWRPQLLVLIKTDDDGQPTKWRHLLTFASQLKAGKGLTLVASVIEGDFNTYKDKADIARNAIKEAMKLEKTKGFADVIVAKDTAEGLSYLVQGSGVGGLQHNSVLLGWPHRWRIQPKSSRAFIDALRIAAGRKLAVMIGKDIEEFPENTERLTGTIDIWWIVHDGGMLMLLPFLLMQHKVWRHCNMRIFTVAMMQDNSIQMKRDIQSFIYNLRLSAEVQVVEMLDKDISAYTYEKTLAMEQRSALLNMINKQRPGSVTVGQRRAPQTARDIPAIIVEVEAGSGDVAAEGASGTNEDVKVGDSHLKVTGENDPDSNDNDDDDVDTEGEVRRRHFDKNLYTFSAAAGRALQQQTSNIRNLVQDRNVKRMHTAVRLNEVVRERSQDARLIIINLPGPPKSEAGESNYMEFLEVLTEGLTRVLMVRGGGTEVITMYS